jgi:hypothetical protein
MLSPHLLDLLMRPPQHGHGGESIGCSALAAALSASALLACCGVSMTASRELFPERDRIGSDVFRLAPRL